MYFSGSSLIIAFNEYMGIYLQNYNNGVKIINYILVWYWKWHYGVCLIEKRASISLAMHANRRCFKKGRAWRSESLQGFRRRGERDCVTQSRMISLALI